MKLLKFEHITFGYKKDKIFFKDLSFEITQPVGKGFVTGLMGISGSGKSTILKLILGIEKQHQGNISILPSNPVITYVPQEPVLFEHLTPIENAEYFNLISNYKSKFNRELFNEVAKTLQIEDLLKNASSVNEISGGQKQRISLLRAMSVKPDILLLDEPLTGLDEEVKDQFLQTLVTLIQRFRLMVIYVTHHRKEAEFISDEIIFIEKNNEIVSSVSKTKTKLFFNSPPTVSALNATKEIRINTLHFLYTENRMIKPVDATSSSTNLDIPLISFLEEVIYFSNESGFEFEVAAETGLYKILRLKHTDIILTMENEIFNERHNEKDKYISFTGKVNLYDSKGQFIKTTDINNNKIIE